MDMTEGDTPIAETLAQMIDYDTSTWAKPLSLLRCFALPMNKAFDENKVLLIFFPYSKKDVQTLAHDISQSLVRLHSSINIITRNRTLISRLAETEAIRSALTHYGHTMGHRVAPILAYFNQISNDKTTIDGCKEAISGLIKRQEGDDADNACLESPHTKTILKQILTILESKEKSEYTALACARLIKDTSMVLQAHALTNIDELFAYNKKKDGRFLRSKNDLDLMALIKDEIIPFAARTVVVNKGITNMEANFWRWPNIEWEFSSAVITREIEDTVSKGKCRLQDSFFTQLINELILNSVNHAMHDREKVVDGAVPVDIKVGTAHYMGLELLVFTNRIEESGKLNNITKPGTNWVRWPQQDNGPGMAIAFFRKMKLGNMYVRWKESRFVQVGLEFKGLHITE